MNNLEMMRKRFEWQGGIDQESRMINDKFRTLQRALKYSYQACTVSVVQPRDLCLTIDETAIENDDYRALINPDKVKQDYDDKIISIPYSSGYKSGDVFEWRNTETKWLIYLREITEDAYFRGEIRRCRYTIRFKDNAGQVWSTWAAIRGPAETKIDSIQKNQERVDKPNMTLNILMPKNEYTEQTFDRYTKFLFAGRAWKVQAIDGISIEGVLQISAEEDYINLDTDDTDNELKDGLIIEHAEREVESEIEGPTFIYPKIEETFSVKCDVNGTWYIVEKDAPAKIVSTTKDSCVIRWDKMTSGQFILGWRKGDVTFEKTIVVESLY